MEQLFPTRFYYWEHCDSARTRSQASKCRGRDCDRNFIWWECDYSESEMENTNVGTKWQKPFKGQLHSIICMYYSIIHSILFVICYPRIADNAMKWNSGLIHHTWFLKKKISTIFILEVTLKWTISFLDEVGLVSFSTRKIVLNELLRNYLICLKANSDEHS